MAEQYSPDPDAAALAAQVLNVGIAIRAGQELARSELAENARIRLEREGSYEVQLAGETERLLGRMASLGAHPHLAQIFRRSALRISTRKNGDIESDPLTDGVIAKLSGEHLLFSGQVLVSSLSQMKVVGPKVSGRPGMFDRGIYVHGHKLLSNERELKVFQRIEDMTTSANARRMLYKVLTYESPTGKRVKIKGSEFEQWATVRRLEMVEAYEEKYPEEKQLNLKGIIEHHDRWENNGWGGEPYQLNDIARRPLDWEKREDLDRLLWRLYSDRVRQYPDEMYLKPLTIVRQMNMLLNPKKQ
jgi:hypothetical protein